LLSDGTVRDRLLRRYEVNVCAACGLWCLERPELLHELPPCKEK